MDPARIKEEKRNASLKALNILFTPKDERFDRITKLAKVIFNVAISGITFVDANKEWFKSVTGLEINESDRENSFSSYVIESDIAFVVEDALEHFELKRNPFVAGGPKIRFYAGIPVFAPDGLKIGSFFIADRIPRKFSEFEINVLSDLAFWVNLEIMHFSEKNEVASEQKKLTEELASRNKQLAEEKAKSDAMLENIGDGIIGVNDRGEIVFTNRQFEALMGWKQEELIGKPLWHSIKLLTKEGKEVPINEQPIRNALFLKKRIVTTDYSYLRKDDSMFPASITATPIIVYGNVLGGVIVFSNITKEKEVDRMKTEFISLASHQLRTPLSAIKWFCEILLDKDAGELNQEQQELLTNVYQSNDRMIELVNTLLNISRIESGRIIIDPKPTDLRKLLDGVIVEIKPRLDKKKQNLTTSFDKDLPLVNIDSNLVRHVYMNLLTNAVKYTPEGGQITVTISISGEDVVSQVSDNGYGIPKGQYEQVFNRFFRAENILKVETEGTGLGLYLTKAIVASSGGKIWFESDEKKGTTFWFSIPLKGSVQKKGEVTIDA